MLFSFFILFFFNTLFINLNSYYFTELFLQELSFQYKLMKLLDLYFYSFYCFQLYIFVKVILRSIALLFNSLKYLIYCVSI